MTKQRWIPVALCLAALAIGGLGFAIGTRSDSGNSAAEPEPSWLLSQTARSGTLNPNADGTYQLVMQGVDPTVVAFTDRPDRDTATLSVQQMTNAWATMFASSAPNAVLVEHSRTSGPDSLVLELFDPVFSGTTMTYTVRILADEQNPTSVDGVGLGTEQYTEPPTAFALASLFIDNMNLRYACLLEDGSQDELYPPGDVPPGGPTQDWYNQCKAAGGGIGETFG